MTFTDTTLEYDIYDFIQEAAGEDQVIILPMADGLRNDTDYVTMQLLDIIPEGNAETLWDDGEDKFAIKQFYSARFSFKTFGKDAKSRLSNIILKVFRDPYYVDRLTSKCLGPMGNPAIIDDTELLTTEFENRAMTRASFLFPAVVLSDVSCIEHITIGAEWVACDGTLIRASDIQVDKA